MSDFSSSNRQQQHYSNTDFLAWLMTMDARNDRSLSEGRDIRDIRDMREARDRDFREGREIREARDIRDAREIRETRDREIREAREAREAREIRENREAREIRQAERENRTQPVVTTNQPVEPVFYQPPVQTHVQQEPVRQTTPPPVTQTQQQVQLIPPVQQQTAPPAWQPSHEVVYTTAPPQILGDVEIIPGWPDPNSNKVFRIQVGTFSVEEGAVQTEQILRIAGFVAGREIHGSLYRVLALNIHASDVFNTIQRLVDMGYRQFWIRD
jgi:hypothetical protein